MEQPFLQSFREAKHVWRIVEFELTTNGWMNPKDLSSNREQNVEKAQSKHKI